MLITQTIVNYKELWEILGKPDKTSIPNSIDFCEVTGKGCELPNMLVNYEELWNILGNTIDLYEGLGKVINYLTHMLFMKN